MCKLWNMADCKYRCGPLRGVKPQVRNCWGANIYIVNIQQGQNFHPAIISSTTVLTSIMIIGWSCFVIMPHKNSYPNHIFGMFPKHSLLFPESNPWNPTFFQPEQVDTEDRSDVVQRIKQTLTSLKKKGGLWRQYHHTVALVLCLHNKLLNATFEGTWWLVR